MTTSRSEADRLINIVAAVIENPLGRVLLVRKEGTDAFMLPGGKLDKSESPLQALERELIEELGCALAGKPEWLGEFDAPAANEPGYRVKARIFMARVVGDPGACAEIADLLWHDPKALPDFIIAPLARDHVLPALLAQRKAA